MKKIIPIIMTASITSVMSAANLPMAKISNGIVEATLNTSAKVSDDYCQGTRFDRLGVITTLNYGGHSYFDKWYEKYSPDSHHSVTGPVEEFGAIGYDEAKVGDTFLKIGVGVLKRPDAEAYNFRRDYEVVDAGTRSVTAFDDRVVYTQVLNDKKGIAYIYEKTVKLPKGEARMVIEHSLKNIGNKAIDTTVYNHNFFVLDGVNVGPDVEATMPFEPNGEMVRGIGTNIVIKGNKLTFPKLIEKEGGLIRSSVGKGTVEEYDFKLDNLKTGAGVRMLADRPLLRVTFWCCNSSACIEPFIKINIAPNETFTWSNIYELYSSKK